MAQETDANSTGGSERSEQATCPYCGTETEWTKKYESGDATLGPFQKVCDDPECRRKADGEWPNGPEAERSPTSGGQKTGGEENRVPGRDNAMAAVFGRLEPCEDCGRPKSEYVDCGTHGYYRCWWCDRTDDDLACTCCSEPVPAGDYPMLSDGEDTYVFCDWTCFDRWYQDGKALDLIPVDEGRND